MIRWWRRTLEPADIVEFGLGSWYGGDCEGARFVASLETDVCSTPDTVNQMIEYESILGADVSVEGCEEVPLSVESVKLSCDVHYSNDMNTAVAKPAAVTSREFTVNLDYGFMGFDNAWYEVDYPRTPSSWRASGPSPKVANSGRSTRARTARPLGRLSAPP